MILTHTYKEQSNLNLFFYPGSIRKKSVNSDFFYVLSNHISTLLNINLGNMLAVVLDWKQPVWTTDA